jgi:type VI protein secretion system component VasF
METNILKWNLPNWITVSLMVATMTLAYGFAMSLWKAKKGTA